MYRERLLNLFLTAAAYEGQNQTDQVSMLSAEL